MKKRNSARIARAVAVFSVAVVIITQTTPVKANVREIYSSIQETMENTSETTTNESIPTTESEEPVVPETSEESLPSDTSTEPSSSEEVIETTDSSTVTSTTESATSSSSATDSSGLTTSSSSTTTSSSVTSPSQDNNNNQSNSNNASQTNKPSTNQKRPAQGGKNTSSTFNGDKTLGNLTESFEVDSLTESNLEGFELPLLRSFEDEKLAAIVAEAVKQLGKDYKAGGEGQGFTDEELKELRGQTEKEDFEEPEVNGFDNLGFVNYVFQELFDTRLGDSLTDLTTLGKKVDVDKAEVGDLLFWADDNDQLTKVAIYLDQERYVMIENPTSLNEETAKKEAKANKVSVGRVFLDTEYSPSYGISMADFIKELKLTKDGQEVIKNYPATFNFQSNKKTEAFIEQIGEDARELGIKYDVFASVMIAQAILESGSGSSGLASAPHYNLFGIKGSGVSYATQEDDGKGNLYTIMASFRSYASYKDSLSDYVELLRGGISGNDDFYKGVWRSEAQNYLQATDELTGKYATDTQYSNKLNSLIATYNLTQFDEAIDDSGVVIEGYDNIPADYKNKMSLPKYNGVDYNTSGSYPFGQCTWYVFNRAAQLGKRFDNFMGNGQDWGTKGAALGYKVKSTPSVGAAISFKAGVAGSDGQYGHVAFVEAVTEDGILISEANVVDMGSGTVSFRVIPNSVALSNSVSYVVPK